MWKTANPRPGSLFAGLLLLTAGSFSPAGAEKIGPDLTCGPSIPRKNVTVVDVREFVSLEEATQFILDNIGEIRVVGKEDVHAKSALGRAWKRAEKLAAKRGCNVVIITDSWSTDGATVANTNTYTGQTTMNTYTFSHTTVLMATTTIEEEP